MLCETLADVTTDKNMLQLQSFLLPFPVNTPVRCSAADCGHFSGVNAWKLTGYDFVIVGLSILFIVRGLWLGLLKQVSGLVALYLGYYIASRYHDRLFPFLKDLSDNPNVVFIAGVAILFVVTFLVAMLVGKGLSHVIEIAITKWFDRFLGGIMGACKAAIVIVLLHMGRRA